MRGRSFLKNPVILPQPPTITSKCRRKTYNGRTTTEGSKLVPFSVKIFVSVSDRYQELYRRWRNGRGIGGELRGRWIGGRNGLIRALSFLFRCSYRTCGQYQGGN